MRLGAIIVTTDNAKHVRVLEKILDYEDWPDADYAALASDTSERGVVALLERIRDDPHWRTNDNALWPDILAMIAALRAQPAGGGDIPQWALPAVESALAMLDEQGYAHTDLAAFRDWLKEKSQ